MTEHYIDADGYCYGCEQIGCKIAEGYTGEAEDGFLGEVMREAHRLRVQRDARRILAAEDRPPASKPEVLTLRQRLARPRSPLKWRIEGWQPAGTRVMLAAQYKAGKTTLVGNLVRSLVDGDPFLDVVTVEPIDGTLVVLDFEMSPNQLDDWLADQKIRNDDRVIVIPLKGAASTFDILDRAVRGQWAAELSQLGCRYLVVDCLRPILDALGLDEHREAGRFLTALDALMADAVIEEGLVVHHMGHVGERSRGDSRLRDWPDAEWRLVREDNDDPGAPRYLSAYGRDVEVIESLLSYDKMTRHLSLAGGSRKDAKARLALRDVLDLLNSEEGLSGRQIEDHPVLAGKHSRSVIRAAIKLGISEGQIDTAPGPKRSTLHFSAPVRRSAPSDPAHSESECASAYRDGAHTAHTDEAASAPVREDPEPRCRTCGRQLGNSWSIERGICHTCRLAEMEQS